MPPKKTTALKSQSTVSDEVEDEAARETLSQEHLSPQTSMIKRKRKEELEKRASRTRTAPPKDVVQRIERALSQRMYLIDQNNISDAADGIGKKFAVLGSTGNVYEVIISKNPRYTCPDCTRGHLCKHILFVLLRVLRVPQNSPLIYQRALLQSELQEIFAASGSTFDQVSASPNVIAAYKKVTGDDGEEQLKEVDGLESLEDVDCPICFENISQKKGSESSVRCGTCRQFMHMECMRKWLQRTPNCCYCRASWPLSALASGGKGTASSDGYINLAKEQGQSLRRDTSTYQRRSWGHHDSY